MNKVFTELTDGEVFTFNNAEYRKIAQVKVSCCRSINAEEVNNTSNRVFIIPSQEVQVNDQL